MRNLRGTYVHRGDAERRQRRVKQGLVVAGFIAASWFAISVRKADTASAEMAEPQQVVDPFFMSRAEARKVRNDLETARGDLDILRGQFERVERIFQYSDRYNISAGLAADIMEASLKEGIDPELGFRVIRLESEFNPRAVSSAGAIGLMQIMPSTGALLEKGITRDRLFDRATNLRLGFHYLRRLIDMYDGNVSLALLAYNRGETAVWRDIRAGKDPGNGYDKLVIAGYTGKGLID